VTLYYDSEQTFLALQLAIESAESHVHMEYFIFQPDETGRAVRDLLIAKCRKGVPCRLLLDYVGCFWWPREFLRSLIDGGIEVVFFMPAVPWWIGRRMNFRNHRKIVVVDGRIGFTGSQNIGDEYLGRLKKFGAWRDTHMRLIGPAVQQLQEVFVEDWHFATGTDLVGDECFPAVDPAGEQVVQIIPTGPGGHGRAMHHLLYAAIAAAEYSVCIATPYFVPDLPMLVAIQSAAYRGVRVQMLIPAKSNHWLVLWAGRSFYSEMCDAGVEIYEHRETMLHSKVVVIDKSWAMVGSANMDQRSFRLNFEVTAILFDEAPARDLYRDFAALRDGSQRTDPRRWRDASFRESILLGTARLASPLL
jgi:cardiolipin synthase